MARNCRQAIGPSAYPLINCIGVHGDLPHSKSLAVKAIIPAIFMTLNEYKASVAALQFGKRLPNAVYVFRATESDFGTELTALVGLLVSRFGFGDEFNVIKFRTDELKLSFLSYPNFLEDAHPALKKSITIDLATGRRRDTDYEGNPNPPILHRKERFIPSEHPAHATFSALTQAEESAGLYEDTATIGFKLNWERLLEMKGLRICGHSLESCRVGSTPVFAPSPFIERHKTALTRYELSKPVKSLLEYGMLKKGTTFFDYGCGQGSDVRGIQALGHDADGWDPMHRPEAPKREADIVNMGYVLNVIEDPAERLEALVDAHRHAKRLLVVSGLIRETVESERAAQYRDGVLTQRNTFQKFFEQQELQQYIEDALDGTAVPVALGVFYVFREPADQQDFLSARSRRKIDWTQVSARLGLGRPRTTWKTLYEAHKSVLEPFGKMALELGRIPTTGEFERLDWLCQELGSPKRALRTYVQGGTVEGLDWEEIRVRFGIGQPPKRRWELIYEENRDLLDSYWSLMLQLGRLPEPEEFKDIEALRSKVGSPNRALRIFLQKGGAEEMKCAAENRRRDLLVYVALANLRKRVPFGHLSTSLRSDIKAFFSNYTRALEKGLDLLFAAGDSGEIELACEDLQIGWQDSQALFLHRSLLDELPPILRAYVGCATTLFGDVAQADVIKLHKSSAKVTFLVYDDFDGKPLPELKQRIKVSLRTRWVQVFDHSKEGQLLYFKERFVAANYPQRSEMEKFSAKLRKRGFTDAIIERGPLKAELMQLLATKGLNENLNPRRNKT